MRKFKLIKEFPLSPSLGFEVLFETEKDFNDGINSVSPISALMVSDCTDYPEFWEEIIQKEEETHRFYIDEPVTIWRRYWYDVKSELYVDAVDRMKEELNNNELPEDIFDESELLLDTETSNGMRELFNEQGEEL